jgi:hypothetical protein
MLILECSQGYYGRTDGRKDGRTDGSVTISLRNFVGEGIITISVSRKKPCDILVNTRINIIQWIFTKLGTYLVLMKVWNPIDFQGSIDRPLKLPQYPGSNKGNAKRGVSPRLTIWPCDLDLWPVKGQGVKFLPHNILVNTLESTSFNGFWPSLIHSYPLASKVAKEIQ